jgi:hypothetical protein
MRKLLLATFSAFALATSAVYGQAPTLTIDWFNNSTTLFRNAAGTPLSQGTAANNDGTLVQLGYFTMASAGNNFAGTFVALTGFGSQPRTTIGDSPDLTGLGNGVVGFSTTFSEGSNLVQVYDPAFDIGFYTTQSQQTIMAGMPPVGTILAIRFFNSNDTSGAYNTVSADAWQWQAPTVAGTNILLNIPSQFASGMLRWEDASSPFLTTIPEPSTYALLAAGIGAVVVARRRRNKRNAAA